MSSQQVKQIRDRIDEMQNRPKIGVFIDLDGLLAERDDLQDEVIARGVQKFVQSVGRFCSGTVYYSRDIVSGDGVDHRAWRSRGFAKVYTQEDGFTEDDLNLNLLFDAHGTLARKQFDVVVLVVGGVNYNELAKRLVQEGMGVVMVCRYQRAQRIVAPDNCIYVPTRTLFENKYRDQYKESSFDMDGFNYASLIRLLAASEGMMPFVGVKYFITRVMWRLGEEFREVRLCQEVFQAAKERGYLEVYERDNIDESENKVSACRLNQEDSLVQKVLAELEEVSGGVGKIAETTQEIPSNEVSSTESARASL